MYEPSSDEFEIWLDKISEKSTEQLLNNFNVPLPDNDDVLLNMLVSKYGHVDEWSIDHWKYLRVMVVMILESEIDTLTNSKPKRISFFRKQQELKDKSDAMQARVIEIIDNKDLSIDEKEDLIKAMDSKHKEIIASLEALKEDKNRNRVGRPSSEESTFKFLDYMVKELGSINKAVSYVTEHPIWRKSNPGSLKRTYRNYRNNNFQEK